MAVSVDTVATTVTLAFMIAASVAGSRNPDAARQFLSFVLTPATQTVLARHGFGKP